MIRNFGRNAVLIIAKPTYSVIDLLGVMLVSVTFAGASFGLGMFSLLVFLAITGLISYGLRKLLGETKEARKS